MKRLNFIFLILAFFSLDVFAVGAFPGACGTSCMANRNYYGSPYGRYPIYPYARMPFHTMNGPSNYYYRPFPPSPYRPVNCVSCAMRYQQYSRPYSGWGSMPMTKIDIPLRMRVLL